MTRFLLLLLLALTGCTLCTYNHAMPKLAPAWSKDAQLQRYYEQRYKHASQTNGQITIQPPDVPQLPVSRLQSAVSVSSVEIVSAPSQGRTVELAWENQPRASAAFCSTYIEATGDFTNWEQVARIPFSTRGYATLTNRPQREFYRAYNNLTK